MHVWTVTFDGGSYNGRAHSVVAKHFVAAVDKAEEIHADQAGEYHGDEVIKVERGARVDGVAS